MGRKRKIQEMNQVDGRDHAKEFKRQSVDEIFGYEKSKFPSNNAKQYEADLKQMNKYDLNQIALSLGMLPIDDKFVLIERIMIQFNQHNSAISAARNTPNQLKISQEGIDILSEGA